ncbi:MAG: M28 family peptidase [Bacteroidia bacterium]
MLLLVSACTDEKQPETPPEVIIAVPAFEADSAYAYIERQLAFGPRVPNTPAHAACAAWLGEHLAAAGAQVTVQQATVRAFDGSLLEMRNIIAAFQPDQPRRIMLTAHWDTRPFADEDSSRQGDPIPGANDGASGVAVLLEIARHLGVQPPQAGVDIILWDVEDYGKSDVDNSYCLGSQYWARNKHRADYQAMYAINLDMVGAEGAYYTREGVSMQYASGVVEKVWSTARRLGHDAYFRSHRSDGLIDDHTYINLIAKIPAIDIIDRPEGARFFPHWHTHRDDLASISRETLRATGETVMSVVYYEK